MSDVFAGNEAPKVAVRTRPTPEFDKCPFCASLLSITSRPVHVGGFLGACSNIQCPVGPMLIDTSITALARRWNTRAAIHANADEIEDLLDRLERAAAVAYSEDISLHIDKESAQLAAKLIATLTFSTART